MSFTFHQASVNRMVPRCHVNSYRCKTTDFQKSTDQTQSATNSVCNVIKYSWRRLTSDLLYLVICVYAPSGIMLTAHQMATSTSLSKLCFSHLEDMSIWLLCRKSFSHLFHISFHCKEYWCLMFIALVSLCLAWIFCISFFAFVNV